MLGGSGREGYEWFFPLFFSLDTFLNTGKYLLIQFDCLSNKFFSVLGNFLVLLLTHFFFLAFGNFSSKLCNFLSIRGKKGGEFEPCYNAAWSDWFPPCEKEVHICITTSIYIYT